MHVTFPQAQNKVFLLLVMFNQPRNLQQHKNNIKQQMLTLEKLKSVNVGISG